MTANESLEWFEDLARRGRGVREVPAPISFYLYPTDAAAWLAEAFTALQSTFPPGHALLRNWFAIFERAKTHVARTGIPPNTSEMKMTEPHAKVHFFQAIGVIDGALALVRAGRLTTLIDGIRAETVSEVLDQADALLPKYTVAATVLAGGALETHLLHLCTRNHVMWPGEGSISNYDQAIGQARNAGAGEVYGVTDSKLIGAWARMRNDAAHDPTSFVRTPDEIRFLIQQVRSFITRVP